jgi:hypothetical protein
MNNQLYSQIKSELKEYPELKTLFKTELIYGQIACSICNNVSISVIPEFINAILQHKINANNSGYILGLIALQKLYDLPEICARILSNQISLGLLSIINRKMPTKIETYAPRVQKIKIIAYIEEHTGELFGIAFLLGFITKESQKKIMNWPLVKQAGIAFGVCHFIVNNEMAIYSRNELIDIFSEKIDTFRNISIKTRIHNKFLEDKYNNMMQEFKTKINLNIA